MAAAKAVKDAADERRRDEAAAVLAPIKALVIDADPVRLTMSDALQHWENDMPRLVEEWRRGREALLKLSISHPSVHMRELAEECEKALHRSMSTASMYHRRHLARDDDYPEPVRPSEEGA